MMQSRAVTRNRPGMRNTHQVLSSRALSARASMLPQESSSTGRPRPRKLRVDSMAMLVLTAEMTTKRMAETTLGTRWRRMIQPKLPPMQREARMYSLWRIWRTSPRTMRARANQPVTPMSRAMLRAFWGDKERFMKEYWQFYWDVPGRRGVYLAGDKAQRDKDGYFFIQGRIDDVLSVAGHRIANAEVESALVAHPKIAEAAVVGKPDEVKGESIVAFVILRVGNEPSPELAKDAIAFVRKTLGPVAAPTEVHFVNDLPKTRSGKIMRRVVKARALGNPVGDISTLMNPEAVDGIPKIV